MCLNSSKNNPKKYSIFKFDKDGYTYCRKRYRRTWRENQCFLISWWYDSKYIKPGCIRSNRQTTRVPIKTDYVHTDSIKVNRGIHVYTVKKHVDKLYGVVVRIRCHRDDLVATACDGSQAVFNKVYLDEKEYNKAISRK